MLFEGPGIVPPFGLRAVCLLSEEFCFMRVFRVKERCKGRKEWLIKVQLVRLPIHLIVSIINIRVSALC